MLGAMGGWLYLCDWAGSPRYLPELERTITALGAVIDERCDLVNNKTCDSVIDMASEQLNEYFTGRRRAFELPVAIPGTEFQRTVRSCLQTIPYGTTMTYAQIAEAIGRPKAVRAVASAIASNPLSIIVPCHRVVASDGTPGGYRGGLPAKQFLLRLEHKASRH